MPLAVSLRSGLVNEVVVAVPGEVNLGMLGRGLLLCKPITGKLLSVFVVSLVVFMNYIRNGCMLGDVLIGGHCKGEN